MVLDVLVAFHSVCLSGSSLSVGEDGSVITVNYLADHALDAHALEETSLIRFTVANFVKLISLRLLVPRVELQRDGVPGHVYVHLAGRIS